MMPEVCVFFNVRSVAHRTLNIVLDALISLVLQFRSKIAAPNQRSNMHATPPQHVCFVPIAAILWPAFCSYPSGHDEEE